MLHEWRTAVGSVARRPALSVAIVSTLAIAIGANSAIFSAIDTVLLKPLPFPEADRLVAVYETNASEGRHKSPAALVRLREWNAATRTFEGFAGSYFENVTDTTGTEPERIATMRTSERFFEVLGVPAAIGRTPSVEEERFGGPAVVVLTDRLWQARFDRDPEVIGRSLVLGGVPRVIVGVMPGSFRYPTAETEAWIPAQSPPSLAGVRQARFWISIARIKPQVALDQAQQDLAAVHARIAQQHPATDKTWTATIFPLHDEQVGEWNDSLWLTLGAVVLVLLTACGNIALLLLADAARRRHDIALRFALGASRRKIIAQHVREGLLLAGIGASVGLIIASWSIDALRAIAATVLPRAHELQIDTRLILFTAIVGVLATMIFALGPAVLATRSRTLGPVAHGARGEIGGFRLLRRSLVAGQIALAMVLLVGAGLLIRSLYALDQVSPGFSAEQVWAFRMSATWNERPEAVTNRQMRTLERLKALPGVTSAALSTIVPATANADYTPTAFGILGRAREDRHLAIFRMVSAEYFRTLDISVEQGETCRDDQRSVEASGLLINRAFATTFLAGEDPIGHSIVTRGPNKIVGVVADARERRLTEAPQPVVYRCGLMAFYPDPYYLVRADAVRPVNMAMIRAALTEVEPQRAVYAATSIRAALDETNARSKLIMMLLSMFGGTSLMLVIIGMYGVLGQFVTERYREIGVRMALGAQPAQVLVQVMRQSLSITAIGLGVGSAGALATTGAMRSLLFAVSPVDPLTFIVVPIVLAGASAAISVFPARRAARVDPLVALRYE